MKIRDVFNKLQEGEKFAIKRSGKWIRGIVGEINENGFFFWHNEASFNGGVGEKNPDSKGFEYSFRFGKTNSSANITHYPKHRKAETKLSKGSKKIQMEIYRKDGQTYFKFDIDERIEEMYKKIGSEVKESKSWKGLKFYYVPELTKDENYKSRLRNYNLFDDYGTGFYNNGQLNIAWLRTEGGKGEIKIKELVSFAEFSGLLRNVTNFFKEHFEDYFKDFKVKANLLLEFEE